MLEFTENMGQRTNLEPTATLTLTWEQRGKCRQRLRLDSGEEAGLFLTRGRFCARAIFCAPGTCWQLCATARNPW